AGPGQRGAHRQRGRNRRGHGNAGADQQHMQDRPPLHHAVKDDGAGQYQVQAQRRGQGRRMYALIEIAQRQQAQRTNAGQQCTRQHQHADQQRGPARQVRQRSHSITSPRSRNLAKAELPMKLSSAMIRAASTYSMLPVRMPMVSNSSMPLTYSASSASTRSCARGPRAMRSSASVMPASSNNWAPGTANAAMVCIIGRSPAGGFRSGA